MNYTIALFGEAGRGEFRTAYYCKTLDQLSEYLGEPPSKDSKGLDFAIQALLFQRGVVYFRVHEEGFSIQDYLSGLNSLENKDLFPNIAALCLPGVGNAQIIQATNPICSLYQSFLILTEKDLYDYLTCYRVNQRPLA
jgi:hypothetical protein